MQNDTQNESLIRFSSTTKTILYTSTSLKIPILQFKTFKKKTLKKFRRTRACSIQCTNSCILKRLSGSEIINLKVDHYSVAPFSIASRKRVQNSRIMKYSKNNDALAGITFLDNRSCPCVANTFVVELVNMHEVLGERTLVKPVEISENSVPSSFNHCFRILRLEGPSCSSAQIPLLHNKALTCRRTCSDFL